MSSDKIYAAHKKTNDRSHRCSKATNYQENSYTCLVRGKSKPAQALTLRLLSKLQVTRVFKPRSSEWQPKGFIDQKSNCGIQIVKFMQHKSSCEKCGLSNTSIIQCELVKYAQCGCRSGLYYGVNEFSGKMTYGYFPIINSLYILESNLSYLFVLGDQILLPHSLSRSIN